MKLKEGTNKRYDITTAKFHWTERKIGRRDSTMVLPQIKNTPLDQPLIPREGRRGFLSKL